MRAAPGASAHMQLCSRTGQPCRPTPSGSSLNSSGGSSSRRGGCWEQQPSGASNGAGPPRHQRQPRRSLARVCAIAVPGPLFMGSDFDRERFRDLKATQPFLIFPVRLDDAASLRTTPPLVRVRLAVDYRVHSRQMLCIGGSQIPFGWSFLSIAKVPASWNPGDVWAVEVELPAGTKVEYKYVILEEQDWTQQVNELSEGKVEYTYRIEPDSSPPDVQRITKQMAIVAWQPGPNRLLQVPTEEELERLQPGVVIERVAPPPPQQSSQRSYGQQAVGRLLGQTPPAPLIPASEAAAAAAAAAAANSIPGQPRQEELTGVWEVLSLDQEGRPFLDRRDVWGSDDQPQRSVRRPLFGR